MQGRRSSTFSRLLRHGFTDPAAAERLLDTDALTGVRGDPVLLEALGATADPDQALLGPGPPRGVAGAGRAPHPAGHADQRQAAAGPAAGRARRLRGAGDHLARHPRGLARAGHVRGGRPAPRASRSSSGAWPRPATPDALRVAYRRCLLGIAARDVCGTSDLVRTAAELADLATATLRAALAIAAAELPRDAAACRLAVIAMGKAAATS